MNSIILCCIFIADGTASVGGSVVYKKDLEIPVGLVYDLSYGLIEIFFNVVYGNNNAYFFIFQFLNFPFTIFENV